MHTDGLEAGDDDYGLDDLKAVNRRLGWSGSVVTGELPRDKVMQGQWSFQQFANGLSIHYGEVTELSDISVSVDLPAGLSFNLVFAGEVAFSLANCEYCLGREIKPIECSAFALSRAETMTRRLSSGMKLHKLNVFAELGWLQARCSGRRQTQELLDLFQHHGRLHRWEPSARVLHAAGRILDAQLREGEIQAALHGEAHAISLLSAFMDDLIYQSQQSAEGETTCTSVDFLRRCQSIIEHSQAEELTLENVASLLNVSISTLQRRFKAAYGTTAIQYLRQQRLNRARKALLRDGLSIGEASYIAGYTHTANFASAFKKQFLLPPSAYVRQKRGSTIS